MTTDNDGLGPAGNKARNVRTNDWLAKYHSAKNVTNGAVWRLPHFLEAKLFNTLFVGSNGGALHANAMLQNCVG